MNTELFLPTAQLSHLVKRFMIIESDLGMINKILPATSVVMAFRYRGGVSYATDSTAISLPTSAITGLRNTTRLVNYANETANLLVIFQEGGAAGLMREPIHELFGLNVSLDSLFPLQLIRDVEEQLAEAKSNRQRVSVVEQFLIRQMTGITTDALVTNAIRNIQRTSGAIRIRELLTDLPISRDPFEKRFRRIVGTSPKQFAEIVRFRHIINQYSPETSLTDTAYTAGYFDQAHFINDFKSFTGQSPQQFFKAGRYW
ncbi:helix-turn-helix domain-containing protein [Spirosoma aerolatum]|uniref:helix-turn-helix domain-containing protein n=1 Tax=Spirosoma aerolatum TaxID=1211326 RepID=UPI0009ADBEED|nr:helix-turn-helix domain-containing protein [Spirosoma aerolatum]